MVNVKKRDGSVEEFKLSNILTECEKVGSTPEQALCVAKELIIAVGERSEVSAEEISETVIKELEKVNKTAAEAYKDHDARRRSGQSTI